MGVIRADGPTDQAQRRVFNTMPQTFQLTFIMSVEDWGPWYNWAKDNGWRWFEIDLPTCYAGLAGTSLSAVLIRFTSDLSAVNIASDAVRITVSAEMAPSMISQYLDAV